ncbi:cytochrome P450 [Echria macrotheca]|uniref:Cytochrome P450 n=1 Tax=Echria macrotheca TaxID=438768 RepID=A0AAJ0F9L3_9PEZI|nr:cytochrome P450 [Echria macrotheca]
MIITTSTVAALAVAAVSSALLYFLHRLNTQRKWYAENNVPRPPHDWLWGHAKLVGEYTQKITGDYMQAAWTQLKYDFQLPEIFYLDMWPFGPEFIMCTGPDATAIATTINVFPQADVVTRFFGRSIGETFIEATNLPLWKELHQMLAPGLTPSATKTYHGLILDQAKNLHDRLQAKARSGEVFDMSEELGRYPFAIIWKVFFGEDLVKTDLYDITKRLADISPAVPSVNPVKNYLQKRERAAIVARLDAEMDKLAGGRFDEMRATKTLPTRTTATCLLDRMLLGHVQSGQPLDERLMKLVRENGKGFLAAGYGTTTDTSSYIMMLLSAFPSALQTLREEHNRIFPPDLPATLQSLSSNPSLTTDLPYTTAVIQETLRLFPIGMVVRSPPPGLTSFQHNGVTYPVKPTHYFGIMAYATHYDPSLFPSPSTFRPERFLTEKEIPRTAYRPFERGLRSCIGQNLAMDEMRIALVVLARYFDFELCGHNPVPTQRLGHTDLDTKLGDHAFQRSRFSAGPNGPALMRVRLADR